MNHVVPSTSRRRPLFSGAALLLAALQFASVVALGAYYVSHPSGRPAEETEWGEGVGGLIFFGQVAIAHIFLILFGFVLAMVSLARREQPSSMSEFAVFVYGTGTLGIVTLVVLRFAATWK